MSGPIGAQEPVYFSCEHLKAAVEDKLWIYDPTPADMLGLQSISCANGGITDLTGLEYAENLQTIYFHLNQISDISPLSGLDNLQKLSLGRNQIHDLSPLSDLNRLHHLDLHGNQLSDISVISGLTNLETLLLRWNRINDISALSGLTNLTYLTLHNNQISDISALSGLTNLTTLYAYDNQISDISALSGMTKLETLSLPNNQISNVSALAGLTRLTELYLHHNQISDISALAGLTNLSMLWVHDNPLNQQACDSYIPQITANNPELIEFQYDTCTTQNNPGNDELGSPSVSTYAAAAVTETSARLEACLDDDGAEVCEGWFRYWVKGRQAQTEARTSKQRSLQESQQYAKEVKDLSPGTTYCFQAVAENSQGQDEGNTKEFTTLEEMLPQDNRIHVDDDAINDPGPDDSSISDPQEDGTDDHPYDSIQEAIEQAQDLDKILVHEGRYYETLNLMGKCLDISRFVPDAAEISAYPVIDAQNRGTVVTFNQGEDSSCQLSGLVLTGGLDNSSGAIACIGASPTIKNCLIVGNRSTDPLGAIIYCEDSHSLFQNLTVYGNASGASGSAFRFTDCAATITNSILWRNAPGEVTVVSGNDPTIVYSDVQGTWPGLGNISTDPLFALRSYGADPSNSGTVLIPDDFHLLSETGRWNAHSLTWIADELTSPCIDAGDPGDSWTGEARPHGARINMGAYGGTDQASCSLRVMPIIAQWTFDESSGDTARDAAGANHGTVYGATWADGVLDGALAFDGEDDYVDCGNDPVLAPDLFTISVWIQAQATSASRTILRKAGGDKDRDYEFELFSARYPTFSFGDGSQSMVLYSSSRLPLAEWTHITLTRSKTEAAIYINGSLWTSKAHDLAPPTTDHSLIIGGGPAQPFKGKIDDVRIHDSVLSERDIADLTTGAD